MIWIDRVSFTYPKASEPTLRGLDLEISEGEFMLVAGASGTGKSTLLRVPTGLVPYHSGGVFEGRVHVAGRDVTGQPPRDLAGVVGFVPQDPDTHATADRVVPELAFAMENLGVPPVRMRKRLEEVLDQLGIAHLRDRRLDSLSGGERQRVAVAAVLAAQPQVLILDEPTSSLDPRSAEDVLGVLARLRDDLGLTVVCSEHRLERVASFADRVCFLTNNGTGPAVGEPRDVFRDAPFAPAVTQIGRSLGWDPLPLTVRDGRAFANDLSVPPPRPREPVADGEPVMVAQDLRVRLGSNEILRGATLGLARGQITALCGRNGAGKTTLLRAVTGLVRVQSGEILLDGEPIPRRGWSPEVMRRIAYIPQRAEALLHRDTVRAEVEAYGDRDRAARFVQAFGLADVLDRHPWTLSAGQRLRAVLAAALAGTPDVCLLDEPTRGLDPPGKDILAELLGAEAGRGATVLLVTHDVELVARVAHRVVLMAEGKMVADGPVREVLGESLLFSSETSKVMRDPRFLVPGDVVGAAT